MKSGKTKIKRLSTVAKALFPLTDLFSQEDIDSILKNENVKKYAGKILPSIWAIAADKNNREKVIEAAFNSLKENQPESASYEKATLMADAMQSLAARLVKELNSPAKEN